MRDRVPLLLLALLGLSGCLGQRMDAALAPLDGRPVSAAFAAFGTPDKEEAEDGNKVYIWKVDEFGPRGIPYWLGLQYRCRIVVTADRHDIVRSTSWRGNAYGCNDVLARRQW